MKLLIHLFISFFILLLSGYNLSDAHHYREDTGYTSTKSIKTPDNIQNNRAFVIKAASPGKEKRTHRTDEKNIEEEYNESVPVKKSSKSSNNLTALFYALTLGHFFYHIKNRLFLRKPFSWLSAFHPLYIRFRVFRL